MWSDSHCHLQDPRLRDALPELLKECRRRGIRRWIVNATREEDWPAVEALALEHPDQMMPAFGLHPWWMRQRKSGWEGRLHRLLRQHPRASLGETGLDLWMQNPDLEDQKAVLRVHLQLARDLMRPLSIHCLKAWPQLLEVFRKIPPLPCGFLLHSYAGPAEQIPEWTALGAYFSFSPAFLAPRRAAVQRLFATRVPLSRLLVETDCPDMPPPAELCLASVPGDLPPAGTRPLNHPLNLLLCGNFLAKERQLSADALGAVLDENFRRLWDFPPPPPA